MTPSRELVKAAKHYIREQEAQAARASCTWREWEEANMVARAELAKEKEPLDDLRL